MKVGITGGTGFMGTHLTRRLVDEGHNVVLVSRGAADRNSDIRGREKTQVVPASVSDQQSLRDAFDGCDVVAHLAGINLERGGQTYEIVHVHGTSNVVAAAEDAGVSKVLLSSFLRARPACGSAYHESKWEAEEIIRQSGLDYTILKPGVTYGTGDHMLDHLSRGLLTFPVFGLVGFEERGIRPLAIEDLVDVMMAALVENRLSEKTVAIVGPEELTLNEAVRRVATVVNRNPLMIPLPLWLHYIIAWLLEKIMKIPITSIAQVRILSEGVVEPAPEGVCDPLPDDLVPTRPFSKEQIERGLPALQPYGIRDLRW